MLYLSQAIGRPVRDRQGEPIGKVADLVPTGADWTHEVKWDGMRVLVDRLGGRAERDSPAHAFSFDERAVLAAEVFEGDVGAGDDF